MILPPHGELSASVPEYLDAGNQTDRGIMDFSKLSNGAKMALIGGAVLVINLFLPWYGTFGFNLNAFDAEFLAWGGSFLAIGGAVVLLLKAMGTKDVAAGKFKPEQLATILAAAGTVLIVLRWLTETSFVKYGLFVGIVAAAVVTFGSFTSMRDAGLDLPGMDQFGRGGDN